MQFISYQTAENSEAWGLLENGEIIELSSVSGYPTLLSFIEGGEEALAQVDTWRKSNELKKHQLADVRVKAPLYPRKNILCVGKNYLEHVVEMAQADNQKEAPKYTVFFTKPYTSIIAHEEGVQSYPELTQMLDYEGELAVIIGKRGMNIPREEALDYVFGYTIMNDISARDLQRQHMQFFKGKSLDTFAPLGPVITHHSAISDPQNLSIKTFVNDELRQNGNTKDMIFSIAEIIEVISAGMTLEPGDIIATGTPSGVGNGFNPPKFLKAGDIVRIEIEGIGTLSNKIV